jgi:hypothetical protein
MEAFLQNQEIQMNIFKVIIFIFCFILVMIMGFYNWLYLSRILKSNDQVGLRPPQHIHHLVKTSIYIPVFTAVFMVFFILMGLY